MYINDAKFEYRNPGHVYVLHPNKVGGSCIGLCITKIFMDYMQTHDSYLEIGSWDGIGISLLAEAYPQKKFYAVDPLGGNNGEGHIEYFCENNKLLDNVFLYPHKSAIALPQLIARGHSFDLIFIDGDHAYDSVKIDINYSYQLLNPNGIVYFHDSDHKGIIRAVEEFSMAHSISHNMHIESGMLYIIKHRE